MDRPRPSHDVTDMYVTMVFRKINVHVVKLGHKVFYANYVCVFIDIDQLKGMQNLVWFKDLLPLALMCIIVMRWVQYNTVYMHFNNGQICLPGFIPMLG